jgi:GT2 family glycosyltransferase
VKISAVILSFNSIKYIEKCLIELIKSFSAIDDKYEIFVVDNGSKDGSVEIINQYSNTYPGKIKGIFFNENTGTTFSRNTALKQSTGEYILILDSDAYVNESAVKCLMQHLNDQPKCGLAVPKLTYPDGRFQLSVDQFPTLIRKLQRFFFLKKIEDRSKYYEMKEGVSMVDYAISAFWLFRRDVLDKVGLLDENIFYSPEDVDYCIRIWKAGYRIDYVNSVSVIHDAQEISRAKGIKINFFTLSHAKGLFYLYFKHKFLFSGTHLKNTYKY